MMKLNKRQKGLLDTLSVPGVTLHCEADPTEEGRSNGGRRFFVEPGGKAVGPKTPQDLIRLGLLVGTHALFADDAQSYVVAP